MKKMMTMVAASMMLLAMLAGCGESNDTPTQNNDSAGSATTEAATNVDDAANPQTASVTDEGDLGDYYVKILDAETGLTDYEGNPVIGVKYEFTNNGEENMMFSAATNAQAFQDGVQLELAIMDETSEEYDNSLKEIKTGITLTCECYYVLTSESDVEIEVTELISLDDTKLVKTFTVA